MKKILITLFSIALFLGGLWGLHLRIVQTDNESRKLVLTTFTVLADMAREVAGDAVIIESITKPGAEIHHYEPTPQDLTRIQDADLILDNGMGLELWAARLYAGIPHIPHATLTDNIEPINIGEGPYSGKANPHAWMSPSNAIVYVENIRAALTQLSPENRAEFEQNAAAYTKRIRQIDNELKRTLNTLPLTSRYLVTCEGAFSYLAKDYELQEIYLWPINADAQGTPKQIQNVIEEVRANRVPTVYCESTVGDKPQRQVVRETNANFGGLFYVDSLSLLDGPAPTYLKMLEYNATLITKGLGGSE